MKTEIKYISKWVGNPPIHYNQYIQVFFSDEEFYEFKKRCNEKFDKYYAFYRVEMFLTSEERDNIAEILNLKENINYKSKANTIIIYYKDHER